MRIEKEYLVQALKKAGIKARIHESLKTLESSGEIQTAGVIRYDDAFTRSGSKKTYADQEGLKHKRTKIWDRETKLKVIIGEATDEKCEEIFDRFLLALERGIWINGSYTPIEVGEVDWIDGKDSILRSRIAVEAVITFKGGVYRDTDYAVIEDVAADIKEEK